MAAGEPERDATWWAEVEESLGHLDAAERARSEFLSPNISGGQVLRSEVTGSWRILQPKLPGQRCACSAPPAAVALPGARAVCLHGRAWRYRAPDGPGHQPLRWVELHGLARWWAARRAR